MVQITNPILPGFNADPSALQVGEDYYVVTSTFNWSSGVALYHSRDLKNWRLIQNILDRESQLDMRGNPESCGIWAPQISYNPHNKLYYLAYTDVKNLSGSFFDLNNFAVTAPSMEGPWSDPIYLNSSGFDPSLFHDEDGRSWLLNLGWEFREAYPHPGPILIQEYDAENEELLGEPREIYEGDPHFGCTEGPHIFKQNDWYYLITAEGGTGYGHAVKIARSRTLDGEFVSCPFGPLLTSRLNTDPEMPLPETDFLKPRFYNPNLLIQKAGHGSLMHTAKGETVLFHLSGRPIMPQMRCTLNRETYIQKVVWKEDWPVLANNAPYPSESIEIDLDECMPFDVTEPGVSDFSGETLSPVFYSLKARMDESWCSLKRTPGALSLRGRNSPYSAHDLSLISRRIQHFNCDISVQMDFEPEMHKHMAGLVAQTGSQTFYYLRYYYSDTLKSPALGLMISLNGELHEEARMALPYEGAIYLKMSIRKSQISFSYSKDGEAYKPVGFPQDATVLSDEFTNSGPGAFDGTFVGMTVHDMNRQKKWAEFREFTYLAK